LTLTHTGLGSNPTASPTNSAACPADQYVEGEAINLSGATPDTGWHISGWTGTSNNSSTASTNSLSMPASSHSASVVYEKDIVTLTINTSGSGSVSRDDNGPYEYGDVVELTAVPATGWHFVNWTGDLTGTENPKSITLNGNRTVTAVFEEDAPTCYTLTLSHSGQGSDPVASPTNSSGCTAGQYVAGEVISLSGATPESGWIIGGWTGTDNDASTDPTNTVTMSAANHAVSVDYRLVLYIPLLPNHEVGGGAYTPEETIAEAGTPRNLSPYLNNLLFVCIFVVLDFIRRFFRT